MTNLESPVTRDYVTMDAERERLADLERRSLLAEQARQLAHLLRTPLSVVELICETIQTELRGDKDKLERISHVMSATAKVSSGLTDAVRATRFADAAPQPIDAIEVTSRVVRLHGGRVEFEHVAESASHHIMADLDAFEAAIMHSLRLIGGTRYHPLLRYETDAAMLKLELSTDTPRIPGFLTERADQRLMAQAAERTARNSGGRLTMEDGTITFTLPLVPDAV